MIKKWDGVKRDAREKKKKRIIEKWGKLGIILG
jgi:hypothetical protein